MFTKGTHLELEFQHNLCISFTGNQEIYYHLNQFHLVTRNKDYNYVPMGGRKNESLTIRTQI